MTVEMAFDVSALFVNGQWKETLPVSAAVLVYLLFLFKGIKLVFFSVKKVVSRSKTELDDKLLQIVENPLRFLMFLVGVGFVIRYFSFKVPVADELLKIGFVISLFWFIYNFVELLRGPIRRFAESAGRLNAEHLAEFLVKVIRFAVLVLAFLVALQEFGINISALLASLGIGGLAVALAAKDTLANFFGGITLIADNPFSKGDWVLIGGKYEGVVESIGLRTTKLRTFEKSVLTLPNSLVASSSIENFSRRKVRRVKMFLPFELSAPVEKVLKTAEEIRSYLKSHPRTAKNQVVLVYLDRIGEYAYEVMVYCFTDTANWEEWLRIKQEWIENFVKIAEKNGVKLAVPTYKVQFLQDEQMP